MVAPGEVPPAFTFVAPTGAPDAGIEPNPQGPFGYGMKGSWTLSNQTMEQAGLGKATYTATMTVYSLKDHQAMDNRRLQGDAVSGSNY